MVYLRALKEIDFDLSVSHRINLYQSLLQAWKQQESIVEFAKFFTLNIHDIGQELQRLIDRFEAWKTRLIGNHQILGGEDRSRSNAIHPIFRTSCKIDRH